MKKFIIIVLLIIVIYYFRNDIRVFLEGQGFLKPEKLIFPVSGKVTSNFGSRIVNGVLDFHNGIDIAAGTGTKIINPYSGTVESVFFNSQGGNQIIIKHDNGLTTGYAHLNSVEVVKGQKVKKFEIIGTVGNTGVSTGPHLHFTVTDIYGDKIDPLKLFVFK